MAGSDWFVPISMARRSFESGTIGTVFAGPVGTVTPLPDALGGDQKQWPALQAAAAKSSASFFELLRAKAHYLMLPKSIIAAMINWLVDLSEGDPGIKGAQASEAPSFLFGGPSMSTPGAVAAVVKAGYGLGRNVPFSEDLDGSYEVLGGIYHEMTHAWLDLHEYDHEMQQLWTDGNAAYQHAVGVEGDEFDPDLAFSEAAAYCVDDRIKRWCNALRRLDGLLLRVKPATRDELDSIKFDFERPVAPDVLVRNNQGNFEALSSPRLSDALRDAIYQKVLDGLPLTWPHFNDTPLAWLRDAVARAAGLDGPW